jgi:hypothetical protein
MSIEQFFKTYFPILNVNDFLMVTPENKGKIIQMGLDRLSYDYTGNLPDFFSNDAEEEICRVCSDVTDALKLNDYDDYVKQLTEFKSSAFQNKGAFNLTLTQYIQKISDIAEQIYGSFANYVLGYYSSDMIDLLKQSGLLEINFDKLFHPKSLQEYGYDFDLKLLSLYDGYVNNYYQKSTQEGYFIFKQDDKCYKKGNIVEFDTLGFDEGDYEKD